MRRLIICADGTWNTPDKTRNGNPVPTNVTKVARAICATTDDGVSQIVYYHTGVGTGYGLLDKVLGGGIGRGLELNITDCYRFLVDNYEEGDEIFLFGFSRGAFTARSLAGMIRKCGVLKPNETHRIPEAFKLYRSDVRPDDDAARKYRADHSFTVRIRMIGVWDTVGALGIPGMLRFLARKKYQFHDVALSSYVDHAYQALSIDERRKPFEPTLWGAKRPVSNPAPTGERPPSQTLEQVWFCGVHSNVGGGYEDYGLSDIAFGWMVEKAKGVGLGFDEAYVQTWTRGEVKGKIYDSLLGWRVLGKLEREIGKEVLDEKGEPLLTNQSLHPSVHERIKTVAGPPHGPYMPPNLKKYLDRNPPK